MPTIRRQPGKSIPANKIDPRHLELWQKRQQQRRNQKVVRVPSK
jgi:hypothetical protein